MMKKRTYFIFSIKFGDVHSANAVDPHIIALSTLLNIICDKCYSPQLDEFAPEGRIDGKRLDWGFEGCENLLLDVKQRFVSIRIGMPKSKWLNKSAEEIRQYLFTQFENALHLMVEKIKLEELIVDDEQLFKDFSIVKQKFLQIS